MNYYKKGLKLLLDDILSGKIVRLVITHKDRLLRFGAELVFSLCELKEVEVVIINYNCTATHQGSATIQFNDIYPPTINTPQETNFVLTQAKQLLGEKQVAIKASSGRASEDFSFFLQKIPGCYFFIGNGENSASCHNPKYNFNDNILPTAIALLATLAINYLQDTVYSQST